MGSETACASCPMKSESPLAPFNCWKFLVLLSVVAMLMATASLAAVRVGEKALVPDYDTYFSYDPVIATLVDGTFVVVWVDALYCNFCEPQGSGLGLFARQLSPLGVPLGTSRLIVPFDPERPAFPSVAAAPDGSYIVAWERFWQRGIAMQRFRDGTPLSGVVEVSTPGSEASQPQVAVAENGNVLVVWFGSGGTPWRVYDGQTLLSISDLHLGADHSTRSVARAGGGFALLEYYYSPRSLKLLCVDSSGANPRPLTTFADEPLRYQGFLAGRPDGEVLLVWRGGVDQPEFIRAARGSCSEPNQEFPEPRTLDGVEATWVPGATAVGSDGWAVAWNRNYQERVVQLLDDDLAGEARIVAGVPNPGNEFDQTEGWIAASPRGVVTTVWNEGFYEPRVYSGSVSVGCQSSATTACLVNDRFMVTVNAADFAGTPHSGMATTYGTESADFWFFNPANREIFIKILNACDLSGNYWEFWSALSNVSYTLTVVDTQTGQRSVYTNPAATIAPAVLEANTIFRECGSGTGEGLPAESVVDTASLPAPVDPVIDEFVDPSQIGTCLENDVAMCLQGGRFRVEGSWRDFQGNQGPMHTDRVSSDSGYGWFFSPGNKEIFLKVLDACTFTGNYWVFAAGLTNVEVTLRVTDSLTGRVYEQRNSLGVSFPPNLDVSTGLTDCP